MQDDVKPSSSLEPNDPDRGFDGGFHTVAETSTFLHRGRVP